MRTKQQEPPLFILNDFTILLEVEHPEFEHVRNQLSRFTDLVKSPANIHTYKITPLSLWNALACGMRPGEIIDFLAEKSKFGIPSSVRAEILDITDRYGLLQLESEQYGLKLICKRPALLNELMSYRTLKGWFGERLDEHTVRIEEKNRGFLKQELMSLGYPVEDEAGFHEGESLPCRLLEVTRSGRPFELRPYQKEAIAAFYREGSRHGGSGVLILPCGAGKTIIGIGAMCRLQCATLILTPNVSSVKQWKRELLQLTDLPQDWIGEYDGDRKEVKPVTIATYQILTHRKSKDAPFKHMHLFNERDWGLIIYDEVHLLPAPIFRVTAEIQATRRLGLTATLVREDGCEKEVYSLIGPKRIEIPWKTLEREGYLANVECREIHVPLAPEDKQHYEHLSARLQSRAAAENKRKFAVVQALLKQHAGLPTLLIGQYLDQLREMSRLTGAPFISGGMPHEEREELYKQFREGKLQLLVVSKVANFAIDLPDAAVAIQISGSFGSRQEEAQRLGRILRPKAGANQALFYTLVSEDTKEQEFALNRQLFLVEQGYQYQMLNERDVLQGALLS